MAADDSIEVNRVTGWGEPEYVGMLAFAALLVLLGCLERIVELRSARRPVVPRPRRRANVDWELSIPPAAPVTPDPDEVSLRPDTDPFASSSMGGSMAVATVDKAPSTVPWQIILAIVGGVAILAAATLEVVILVYHSTSIVTKSGTVTTTVTGPSAPPAALVTTCLGAGVVLLLVAAFFSRISKVAITGVGEIDLNSAATLAGKVAAKTGGDPAKATQLYKTAASQAAALVSQRAPATARIASFAHVGWNTESVLDDHTLQKMVDDAASGQ